MIESTAPPPSGQIDPSLVNPGPSERLTEFRNQAIEAVLNPDSSLPKVVIVDRPAIALRDREQLPTYQDPSSFYDNHNYAVRDSDNRYLGRALLHTTHETEQGPIIQIDAIDLSGNEGQGYGKALYLELLKSLPSGSELTCDPRGVSPEANKIWQWLESRGLASRPQDAGDPIPSETGKYRGLGYTTHLAELTSFAMAK